MAERLFSAWRAAYVGDPAKRALADGRSVFTAMLESELPDEETNIVHRGELCFVVANLFPYTSGHVLVVPNREVADLEDLAPHEATALWATVTETVRVVRAVYAPHGMNVGFNLGRFAGGSVPGHLHVHVVPRWSGDTNFMSAVADTQTLPETPRQSANRLRAAWAATSPP